jgi:adenine deaminase
MDHLPRLLAVARGHTLADLVLQGGQIINVFTGEIEQDDVAVCDGRIAGIGPGYRGKTHIDLAGAYVAPGLIDAHVHLESSLCTPAQFASAVVPRGVTTVVADPHEIANVAGPAGVEFIASASAGLPLEVIVMAPSCVPATDMATSGGTLTAEDLRDLRSRGVVRGLGEVMNFPAVINADAATLAKIAAMQGRPIDGHCPAVTGHALNAYAAAGIATDHESITPEEAREKLARGLYLLIREATNAKNLDTLLPIITPANSRRICFCTDDRTPGDLLNIGSIDHMLRRAIARGIDPIDAIRMATLNPAECYGLSHVGAIAPDRLANLIVFDDLRRPEPRLVFSRGESVADWTPTAPAHAGFGAESDDPDSSAHQNTSDGALGRCHVNWNSVNLTIPARSDRIRVIGCTPDQLVTQHRILPATKSAGQAIADPSRDLLKIAVIERHRGTGNVGLGFIQGIGLRRGAIAGTFAHDHHNLVTIGADDQSMLAAARAVTTMAGGLAVAAGERVLARLPLPIGGLMTDRPINEVAAAYADLLAAARDLGSPLPDPFMAMSFMALEVIPSLKLADRGLVDVEQFKIVDLFA